MLSIFHPLVLKLCTVAHTATSNNSLALAAPCVVLAVSVLVGPLEVAELLPGPSALEVLLLVLLVGLGVRQAVLHHVLEAADQPCSE